MNAGWAEDVLTRAFRFNPCIAVHELRMRARKHGPYTDPLACALLSAIGFAVTLWIQSQPPTPPAERITGRPAFLVVVFSELTLLWIILPSYAAGAIAMEREKKTLEMLRFTLLSPADVVTGKLVPLMAIAAILLAASLPIATWCLALGGVSPWDIFFAYTLLFAVALLAANLGLLCSALSPKVQTATSSALVLLIGLMFVPLFVVALIEARRSHNDMALPVLAAIAIVALGAVLGWYFYAWLRRAIRAYYAGPPALALCGVAGLAALALVGLFVWSVAGLVGQAPQAVLLGFEPYVALWGVLSPEDVRFGAVAPRWAVPFGAAGLQVQVWVAAMGAYLATSWALWAVAVGAFRAKGATAG